MTNSPKSMPLVLQPLPVDLVSVATDEEKLSQLPFFIEAAKSNGSINAVSEGIFQNAAGHVSDPGILHSVFPDNIVSNLIALLTLYLAWKMWRSDKRKNEIVKSEDEESIQCIIKKVNLQGVKSIPYLKAKLINSVESSPIELISDALLNHLEGNLLASEISFRNFEAHYRRKTPLTSVLVHMRFAKLLSAKGEFEVAKNYYQKVIQSRHVSKFVRAQAARESCNALTQLAWEGPGNSQRWRKLGEMTLCLDQLVRDVPNGNEEQEKILAFLRASHEEFVILAKTGGTPSLQDLEEVYRVLEKQVQLSETTGQNRFTQLAAAFLRAGDPYRACSVAARYEIEKDRGDLELSLNYLVKALAYQKQDELDKARNSIKSAEMYLDRTTTDRFKRLVRFIRVNLDPDVRNVSKLGAYIWSFYGATRNVRAFVPVLPHLSFEP